MSTEFKLRYHNSFIDVEFPALEEGLHARAQSLSPRRNAYKHDLWDEHDQERLEQEQRDQSYVRCLSEKLDFLSPDSLKTPSFTTSDDSEGPATSVEEAASQSPQGQAILASAPFSFRAMDVDTVVQAWRQINGVTIDGDFAFFFSTRGEAQAEAGEIVANAWQEVRRRVTAGVDRNLVAILEKENQVTPTIQAVKPPAVTPPPVSTSTKRPAPRVVRTAEKPPTDVEKYRPFLQEIGQLASWFQPGEGETEDQVLDAMQPLLSQLLGKTEGETLQRVKLTWLQLGSWADEQGLNLRHLSASQLGRWYSSCKAPSRVLPSLQWIKNNLRVAWDLSLCVGRVKQAKGHHGVGARQAPTAEPAMFYHLLDAMEHAVRNHTAAAPALVVTYLQAAGCVRLTHVQRSKLVKCTQTTLHFVCPKGKQKGQRQGFVWTAPRVVPAGVVSEDLDLAPWFKHYLVDEQIASIGFDILTKGKLTAKSLNDTVKLVIRGVVPDDQLDMLSSKSWRQVPVTWAQLAQLHPSLTVAMGNWTDKAPGKDLSQMPLRYTGSKQYMSNLTKQAFILFMAEAAQQREPFPRWDSMTQATYLALKNKSFEKASEFLQQPEAVFFSAQSAADAHSLTQLYFTIRVRGLKNRVPILARENPELARKPHLPVETAATGEAEAASAVDLNDDYFDALALQRWSRPGHSGSPEPPTVVYRHGTEAEAPVVILGGNPDLQDLGLLENHRVKLVVTCYTKPAAEQGAVFPSNVCIRHWVISSPKRRDRDWAALKPLIRSTLDHGSSILVHCMAGVHRAPVATGIVLAALQGQSLDSTMRHIRRVRAIEDHKMLGPNFENFTKWANDKAEGDSPPCCYARIPVQFISSENTRNALWHLVPYDFDEANPKPLCQWKRKQASFKGLVSLANSVQEALVYDRPFCSNCAQNMPAGALGELENAAVTWRAR
eukprot:s1798_g9.t1